MMDYRGGKLGLFLLVWICSVHYSTADESAIIHSTDACQNSGKYLKCQTGNVLKIHDVECIPGGYTCPEKNKTKLLCDGQRSCASIGLRQQLNTCQTQAKQTIRVTFGCEQADIPPPCRTNVCSTESTGMMCRTGDVIHILGAKCEHGKTDCSWKVYHNLYTVCEGKQSCHSSGLRLLGLKSICEKDLRVTANVFVDYICIQASLSDDTCSGSKRVLSPRFGSFGIIKSPGFPNNPTGNPDSCYWAIDQGHGQEVDVTVHVAYSQERTMKCTPQFLQVNYTDCATSERKVEIFCHVSRVNIKVRSCGSVFVRSDSYSAGEDRGNRFLLSYEVKGLSTNVPSYTPHMRPCDSIVPYSNIVDDAQVVNSTLQNQEDEDIFDPDRFSLIFKIVVINFFLFVIAFCLVVSIILVCYKYRQAKKRGKYNLTNQSDTDSGRRTQMSDTQMQTFSDSSQEEVTNRNSFKHPAQHKHNTYASLKSEEPFVSVNRAQCRSVASYNEINTENRISSFRPTEGKNPYASYDSLDYDVPSEVRNRSPEVTTSADICYHPDNEFPPPPADVQIQEQQGDNSDKVVKPSVNSDVPHYTINDDEYAIVQKPRRDKIEHENSYNRINQSNLSNNTWSANSNQSPPPKMQIIVNDTSAKYPQKHSPQYDAPPPRRESQFSSDVGYLPHHDCMLADHHCNIPPVPPSPARHNGYPNMYNDRL